MRKTISLNDDHWRFGSVSQKPFGPVFDLSEVEEWLPATVPGDVRLDLLRAHRIPDPFVREDNYAGRWVDALDWWYIRELELEGTANTRRFVSFEGIDYQSAVFWNDVELGRHEGMFSRQVYELPREGSGILGVRIWGSDALPRLKLNAAERMMRSIGERFLSANPVFPDRIASLKCQMSYGWDFAPRLRACGIWDDAVLVQTRGVFIRDVWVQSVPDGRVVVLLNLEAERELALRASLTVRGITFMAESQEFEFEVVSSPSRRNYEFQFRLREPRAWNPWDRGEPNLYELDLRLFDEAGELDSTSATFGLRAIDLTPNPGAPVDEPPWTFVVNGSEEFIRGANWVPADAIPARVGREDYAELIQFARSANVNLLRVWGGGLREKRSFYDLCDEQGILIWQEFPFSGAPFDHLHRDDKLLAFARDECGAIVRALRNHPSLALWCGGNEFSTSANARLVKTLRETVAENDGTRPFKPASPSAGEHHNWRVWHWSANTRDYRDDDAGFYGEFGLQAPPSPERLASFIPEDKLWPPGELWVYHNAELEKLWRYALTVCPGVDSLEGFVRASQQAQVRGLQIMIEHARRRKGRVSGCAFWQFNEPWPAICWSVVDYGRYLKPAYFKIKELYNPILLSFAYPLIPRAAGDLVLGDLWVINDLLRPVRGEISGTLNGAQVLAVQVQVGANRAAWICEFKVAMAAGANALEFNLSEEGTIVTRNEYDLNYCDVGEISKFSSLLEHFSARFKR